MSKKPLKTFKISKDNASLYILFVVAGLTFAALISLSIDGQIRLNKDRKLNDPQLNETIDKRLRNEISGVEYQYIREQVLRNQKSR